MDARIPAVRKSALRLRKALSTLHHGRVESLHVADTGIPDAAPVHDLPPLQTPDHILKPLAVLPGSNLPSLSQKPVANLRADL
jgi:hypothetical protein